MEYHHYGIRSNRVKIYDQILLNITKYLSSVKFNVHLELFTIIIFWLRVLPAFREKKITKCIYLARFYAFVMTHTFLIKCTWTLLLKYFATYRKTSIYYSVILLLIYVTKWLSESNKNFRCKLYNFPN